jgi:hypothetical protein
MKTLKITPLEKVFLDALIKALYAEPGFSDVDVTEIAHSSSLLSVNQAKGCFGSLCKKGVVNADSTGDFKDIIYLKRDYYGLHPDWSQEMDCESIEIQII